MILNNKKRVLISVVSTLAIIVLLIFSGPVSAVTLYVHSPTSSTPTQGQTIYFVVEADIEYAEVVPIQNVSLIITPSGAGAVTCTYSTSGTLLNGTAACNTLSLTALPNRPYNFTAAAAMYGSGYGYEMTNGTGTSNITFDSGNGYGYSTGYVFSNGTSTYSELAYNVTWNTAAWTNAAYTINFYANAYANNRYYQYRTSTPLTITIGQAFHLSGKVYDIYKNALNNTNVTLEMYAGGPDGTVTYYSALSNSTGDFNITGIPYNDQYSYKPVLVKYNGTKAQYVGPIVPDMPAMMFAMIGNVDFYLKEGCTLNITAYRTNNNTVAFNYMVKDVKLGYPIKTSMNFNNQVTQATIYLPADRNYSIMMFPYQSMPTGYAVNNISAYGTSPQINVAFNTTEKTIWLSGYIKLDDNVGFSSIALVPYLLEAGNMVFKSQPMPYNMSAWRDENHGPSPTGATDSYNATSGFYNITIPGSAMGTDVLLFATAKNNSIYYGAFRNITLTADSTDVIRFNFSLTRLAGVESNITLNGAVGGSFNITTAEKTFKLQNSSGSAPSNAHVEFRTEYAAYGAPTFTYMVEVQSSDNGILKLPIFNTSISRINIYTPDYAPMKTSLTQVQLNPTNVTINLTGFRPGGINESITDIVIGLYKSSSACDVPSPASSCMLGDSEQESENFNPFSAVIGGGKLSFRMRKSSNNITVHYVNVDMLASGPPDALFDSSANSTTSGTTIEEAWRFGSKGPEIYDHILVGMPYNQSSYNESDSFNVTISKLYDASWNTVWDKSLNTTSQVPTDYNAYAGSTYINYITSGMECSKTSTTATCYIDTTTNMVWIKIPHFSGVAPKIVQTPTTTTTAASTTGGSSSGGMPTTTSNVESSTSHLWSEVPADTPTSMTISSDTIPVTDVVFTIEDAATSVQLTVASLKAAPSTPTSMTGGVYKYLEITASNIANDNIKETKIKFKVAKAWLTENNAKDSDVALFRYVTGTGWVELSTVKLSADDTYTYYEATSPGFSYFAIGIKGTAPVTEEEQLPEEITEEAPPVTGEVVKEEKEGEGAAEPVSNAWIAWLIIILAIGLIAGIITSKKKKLQQQKQA